MGLSVEPLERFYYPVAGVDEVGRGALFGDVVAAAVVILPNDLDRLQAAGVADSKQLSARQREQLAGLIRTVAVDCQVGVATVAEIASSNILRASLLAMERAIAQLRPRPDLCLVDGNCPIPFTEISPIPQVTLVGGDRRSIAIAAASIVAKVWRDREMIRLAACYPGYGLEQHKGYGTPVHREALARLGPTPLHRRSFRGVT